MIAHDAIRPADSQPRLPDFLIIGAMKAGSTSLARYLGAHPQVYLASCKEVHFFDRHHSRGIHWYAEHFREVSAERAVGEATPNYLYLGEAIERIGKTLPDAKLIVVLRNPVDRAYSHYWHEKARGRENLDFERAIEAESTRLASADVEMRTHVSYLDQGRYLEQLLRVMKYFRRERLHVLLSEDLRSDPGAAICSICDFLDVDPIIPENVGKKYNAHISFRSLRVRSWARALSAGGAVERLLGKLLGRVNTRRRTYSPLDERLRMRLTEFYKTDNEALAEWLGRDLAAWTS